MILLNSDPPMKLERPATLSAEERRGFCLGGGGEDPFGESGEGSGGSDGDADDADWMAGRPGKSRKKRVADADSAAFSCEVGTFRP
jgi:hypothetical protein